MCFLLNMYNVKNKDKYSLCGDNLYIMKFAKDFKIITEWFQCQTESRKTTTFLLNDTCHVQTTPIRYESLKKVLRISSIFQQIGELQNDTLNS